MQIAPVGVVQRGCHSSNVPARKHCRHIASLLVNTSSPIARDLVKTLQIGLWGLVEASGMGGHDVDEADMKARLAAAHLFHRLIPTSWR